jgi:hypothetical protein
VEIGAQAVANKIEIIFFKKNKVLFLKNKSNIK